MRLQKQPAVRVRTPKHDTKALVQASAQVRADAARTVERTKMHIASIRQTIQTSRKSIAESIEAITREPPTSSHDQVIP